MEGNCRLRPGQGYKPCPEPATPNSLPLSTTTNASVPPHTILSSFNTFTMGKCNAATSSEFKYPDSECPLPTTQPSHTVWLKWLTHVRPC